MITYNAEGIAMPKIKKRLTSKWIKAVAASHGRKVGEVGYLFVNDDKILEVNREYLGLIFSLVPLTQSLSRILITIPFVKSKQIKLTLLKLPDMHLTSGKI